MRTNSPLHLPPTLEPGTSTLQARRLRRPKSDDPEGPDRGDKELERDWSPVQGRVPQVRDVSTPRTPHRRGRRLVRQNTSPLQGSAPPRRGDECVFPRVRTLYECLWSRRCKMYRHRRDLRLPNQRSFVSSPPATYTRLGSTPGSPTAPERVLQPTSPRRTQVRRRRAPVGKRTIKNNL